MLAFISVASIKKASQNAPEVPIRKEGAGEARSWQACYWPRSNVGRPCPGRVNCCSGCLCGQRRHQPIGRHASPTRSRLEAAAEGVSFEKCTNACDFSHSWASLGRYALSPGPQTYPSTSGHPRSGDRSALVPSEHADRSFLAATHQPTSGPKLLRWGYLMRCDSAHILIVRFHAIPMWL
jgi:hypothetical protein